MKIQSVASLIIIAGTALSMSVQADSGSYGNGKSRFLGFFDTNGDNIVTMDEFNDSAAKRFEMMDTDSNGSVSKQEFQSYIGKKREQRREYKFQAMDGDRNGQVTQEEYLSYQQKRMQSRFQRLDTNGDGVVSKEEYDTRKSRWSGHKHGCHGKGGIFDKLDGNKDGQITREESLAAWTNWFKRIDANGDQVVTTDEVRDYRSKKMSGWK